MDTLTPIGVILNELIVNALKHAFVEITPESQMTIDFYKQEKKLLLKVTNNAIDFKGNVNDRSFGLILINALSQKLDAAFTMQVNKGSGSEAMLIINDFEELV